MNSNVLKDRTALVTGGARGIGRAICLRLAEEGARVAINFERNADAAAQMLKMVLERSGAGITVQGDVSKQMHVDSMVAQTRAHLGPIDFLVNNAGITGNM